MSSFLPHLVTPSLSLTPALNTAGAHTSVYPPALSSSSSIHPTFEPTPPVQSDGASDVDWSEAFTIEATDLLLPDMNSIEYYTTQLAKENTSLSAGAELRGNVTVSGLVSKMSISTTHLAATRTFTVDPSHMLTALFGDDGPMDDGAWAEESSGSHEGYEPLNDTSPVNDTALSLQPVSVPEHTSIPTSPPFDEASSIWEAEVSTTQVAPTPDAGSDSSYYIESGSTLADATAMLPDDVLLSSLPTDVYWFTTESVPLGASSVTPVLSASAAPTPVDSATPTPDDTPAPGDATPSTTISATVQSSSLEPSPNDTSPPPIMIADEGVREEPTEGHSVAPTASAEANATSPILPVTTTAAATTSHITTSVPTTGQPEAITSLRTTTVTTGKSPATTPVTRQYLCSIDNPAYAVRVGTFVLFYRCIYVLYTCVFIIFHES